MLKKFYLKALFVNKNTFTVFFLFILSGCSSLPEKINFVDSYAYPSPTNTLLSKQVSEINQMHPDLSGFYPIIDSMDALTTRIKLINSATQSIDAQYYIWHNDISGRSLFHRLLAAADRGVKVRLLLDDLDAIKNETLLSKINSHSKIEIRLFNPLSNRSAPLSNFLTDGRRVNHRMHNKSLTVDNLLSILGSRNIGDEYFGVSEEIGFSDLDVLTTGPVVNEVSKQFDLYWNSPWTYPLSILKANNQFDQKQFNDFKIKFDSDFKQSLISNFTYVKAVKELQLSQLNMLSTINFEWSNWKFVYDQPNKVATTKLDSTIHLAPELKKAMDRVTDELIIVSPYFVPGEQFTQYLIALEKKGVNVLIMTNSLASNDVQLVHAAYIRYRKKLLKGGIEIFEYKANKSENIKSFGSSNSSLHAKFLGLDKKSLFVGSFNFDPRSVLLNLELGVFFESEKYSALLSDNFQRKSLLKAYRVSLSVNDALQWTTMVNGQEKTVNVEPETNFWQRLKVKFMSIFVPENQL